MEAWNFAAVQQHSAHFHRLLDAVVPDGGVVVLDWLDDLHDFLWDLQLGELDKLSEGLVTLDRQIQEVMFRLASCDRTSNETIKIINNCDQNQSMKGWKVKLQISFQQ